MLGGKDYLRDVKIFTTSQYWNAGVRITAGVMLPTLVLANAGWLAMGMPFLWGALFASITDSPGPIHHRRNGLMAAVAFNTITLFITLLVRDYPVLLITEIIVFGFFFSLLGVFGNRAGAIGVLAMVIMLIAMGTHQAHTAIYFSTLLIFAGGVWYTGFSLLLYRIRPYRVAEQAVGENILAIAGYLQARASLYKEGAVIQDTFNRVMEEQSAVLKSQDQAREIIFKTRQFVGDASPKSRSIMMIFLDSIDLLEQTMTAYQDYELLHRTLDETGLLNRFYGTILQVSASLEHIGLRVQAGQPIRNDINFTPVLCELVDALRHQRSLTERADVLASINALEKAISNLSHMARLMQRLVQYTRHEIAIPSASPALQAVDKSIIGQPIRWRIIQENLTLKSNTFRHALRLTLAMLIGYGISLYFSLEHAYWVLLTIVTILKPVYAVSRSRNMQRVGGTLLGALVGLAILYFISSTVVLVILLVLCMIMGYSLLRINYFAFVFFLTLYIIITFHFLNPAEFHMLIKDRLLDTVIGSVIAGLSARFILPVWGSESIETDMLEMLTATQNYFEIAWRAMQDNAVMVTEEYKAARKDSVVALTNLSENFQRILSEPKTANGSVQLHQFVIASHLLSGHIAALSNEKLPHYLVTGDETTHVLLAIQLEFKRAANTLKHQPEQSAGDNSIPSSSQTSRQLTTIYTLVRDIRLIVGRMQVT